jgi:type IV pilus assembly protein PilQ
MSKKWRPFGLACMVAGSLLITTNALRADTEPSVRVTSAVGQGVVRLDAKASGPFEYTVHHPSPDLYIINLSGVSASATDAAQVLGTDLVRSYRLEQYESGTKTVSQLEILVGEEAAPKVVRQGPGEILILVSKKDVLSASAAHRASPRIVDASLRTSTRAPDSGSLAAIQQISVAKDGAAPEVLVLGTGPMSYQDLRLSNPARLVLDFAGARMAAAKKTASTIDPIRDVRAGQFSPKIARVVIDLSTADPYTVKHVDGGLAVEFQPAASSSRESSAASSSTPASSVTEASTSDNGSNSSAAPSASSSDQSGTPATSASGPTPAPRVPSAPASTDPTQTSPPAAPPAQADPAQSSASPAGSSALAQSIAPPAAAPAPAAVAPVEPPSTPAVALPTSSAAVPAIPSPAISSPTVVNGMPTAVITQQAVQSTGTMKYTGAPTSLNFKDLDVLDFFRLIHELSGLNVVVDPNVKGRLTIVLDNVPWDQALDIVLKNFDLDKQVEGNVIRIATKDTLKKEADEAKDLAKAQLEAADVVTTTHVLSYAKAADLVATIQKFLSSRGDVLADTRTNTLIISDIPSVMPVIENLIRELDVRSQQVEIEARVVAANRSFSREIGSQFAFAGSTTSGRGVFGGNPNVGTSPIQHNPPLPVPPLIVTGGTGNSMPLATNLGATVATSGVTYAFSSPNFALDYLISAAEAKGVGKLLSKPKLVAQNNLTSTVKQGTKIPIQTVVNNTISVQFIDAVLELQVTPQITADGTIFMNVHVENTQIDPAIPRVNGIPALDTQAEDTQVTVNDGQTIMIGGIIISNQQTSIDEVPYVGSLPIIGRLFKHTTVSTNSQELLFFITPRILPM